MLARAVRHANLFARCIGGQRARALHVAPIRRAVANRAGMVGVKEESRGGERMLIDEAHDALEVGRRVLIQIRESDEMGAGGTREREADLVIDWLVVVASEVTLQVGVAEFGHAVRDGGGGSDLTRKRELLFEGVALVPSATKCKGGEAVRAPRLK